MNCRNLALLLSILLQPLLVSPCLAASVRDFGATGDGTTLDTAAVNAAIEAVAHSGGGTVEFPAGNYLCHSIHLRSHVTLRLEAGSTILAADAPAAGEPGGYDPAEPAATPWYQDFGHSHFHNSLIWGEDLEDVAIVGPGRIYGRGLSRGTGRKSAPVGSGHWHRDDATAADQAEWEAMPPVTPGPFGYPRKADVLPDGVGNKAIALKNCRNVTLRDFTVLHGGHFAILATGVDNLVIDGLRIDTNRDGIDIDACNNVHVSACSVNSPWDDAICLKASNGLGTPRVCENVTVTGCNVSGYDEGTLLDGTRKTQGDHPAGAVGRIKLGTEGTGGFRNVAVSNCTFTHCRGLALEQVDGSVLEDVVVSNITMRDIFTAPIFIRLGARLRGPGNPPASSVRRVLIENVNAWNVMDRQGIFIAGVPGHRVEDVSLSHVRVGFAGGGTAEQAAIEVPEMEDGYPEPGRFGPLPSWGLYVRHVADVRLNDVRLALATTDARPVALLEDVVGCRLVDITTAGNDRSASWVLKETAGVFARDVDGMADAPAK